MTAMTSMGDVWANYGALSLLGIALFCTVMYLALGKKDKPRPAPVEPVCSCEYVDVGIGSMLAVPDPECPVHSLELLAAMTYGRHSMERALEIEAVRTHWAHEGCPCGCGDAA